MKDWKIDIAESRTPRHIHVDERELFNLLRDLIQPYGPRYETFFKKKKTSAPGDVVKSDNGQPEVFQNQIPGDHIDKLLVGIANLHVSEKDISASYEP